MSIVQWGACRLLLTIYREVRVYSVLLLIKYFDSAMIRALLVKKSLTASPKRQMSLGRDVEIFFHEAVCMRSTTPSVHGSKRLFLFMSWTLVIYKSHRIIMISFFGSDFLT